MAKYRLYRATSGVRILPRPHLSQRLVRAAGGVVSVIDQFTSSPVVIGMNLTDLGPDGESDPITTMVLDVATAAAKVVSSPADFLAATVSLAALRASVDGELAHFPELLDAINRLLVTVSSELEGTDD